MKRLSLARMSLRGVRATSGALALVAVAAASTDFTTEQQRTFFGITAPGIYLPPDGDRFLGYYEGGDFVSLDSVFRDGGPVSDPIAQGIDSWFPLRVRLNGLASGGGSPQLTVDSVPQASGLLYAGTLAVSQPGRGAGNAGSPILFWTGDLRVERVDAALESRLDTAIENVLRAAADQAFRRAMQARTRKGGVLSMRLGTPRVWRAAGDQALVASYPVLLPMEGGRTDGRGAVTVVYAPRERAIRLAVFGHPEWHPDAIDVQLIEPRFFFRIAGDSRLYALVQTSGPWESIGFAIVDVSAGRIAVTTASY